MKPFGFAFLAALLVAPIAAKAPRANDLVVHEWGTFLAMNGSDGVALDGMYHEEHALPAFVHSRAKDQLHLPGTMLKGETPVIYFYTRQPQQVEVSVRFPAGIWTQWYPQASMVGPKFSQSGSLLEPRNGRIAWFANLVPAEVAAASLPPTSPGALWRYARDVDSAYVRAEDRTDRSHARTEWERFLFYRGLGRAELPLEASMENGGTLGLSAGTDFTLRRLFVLRVENGRGAFKVVSRLSPGERLTGVIPSMDQAMDLSAFSQKVDRELASALEEAGLYSREAEAMVNTWRASYFQTDGIRVLSLLPQEWTDRFIPLQIDPAPKQIVRVMVGRTELLSPERERQAADAVRSLASGNQGQRERAFAYLRAQGRYVEPILRRTLRTTQDPQVAALCKRLLLTDFVTELRAAANAPVTGAPTPETPLRLRAQLAGLLREVGLDDEARAEGEAALQELRRTTCAPLDSDEARHYLRAYARAMEGLGDNHAAAQAYSRFVEFGSQVSRGCGSCHDGTVAPKNMDWFRDWYAGKRYARYTLAAGEGDAEDRRLQAELARDPSSPAATLLLAYLCEARGATSRANALWSSLDSPQRAQRARRNADEAIRG